MRRRHPLDPDADDRGARGDPHAARPSCIPHLDPDAFAREAASPEQREPDRAPRPALGDVRAAERARAHVRRDDAVRASGRSVRRVRPAPGRGAGRAAARSRSTTRACSASASRIARTLQESLLPPLLPELPGVDVGARFHAAGRGLRGRRRLLRRLRDRRRVVRGGDRRRLRQGAGRRGRDRARPLHAAGHRDARASPARGAAHAERRDAARSRASAASAPSPTCGSTRRPTGHARDGRRRRPPAAAGAARGRHAGRGGHAGHAARRRARPGDRATSRSTWPRATRSCSTPTG